MTEETRHPGCLDANVMAEYIDGGLEPRQRAEVEAHLAECEACYENFAETVRMTAQEPMTSTGAPSASPAPRTGAIPRWYRWAAAACLIIASGAGIFSWTRPDQAALRSLSQLARADGSERPALGRLSGPFAWRPEPATMRGREPDANPTVAVRSAALTLEALATDHPSAVTLHAHGLALIAMGQPAEAIDVLTRAVALGAKTPREAEMRSDLGAAWLEKWRRTSEPQDAARGLSEIEVAFADGARAPAVLFNRALALTALDLTDPAITAWRDYLAVESSGAWPEEARRRLSQLNTRRKDLPVAKDLGAMPPEAWRQVARTHAGIFYQYVEEIVIPAWANAVLRNKTPQMALDGIAGALDQEGREPAMVALLGDMARAGRWPVKRRHCLAAGLERLHASRQLWDSGDRTQALAAAQESSGQFTCAGRSPVRADALWAWSAFIMGRRSDAIPRFPSLIAAAQEQGLWRAGADLLRLEGVGHLGAGRPSDAIAAYEQGLALAQKSGDAVRAALIETNLAEVTAMLGDYQASWRHLRSSFRTLDSTVMPTAARYSIVSSGVATASREGLAGTVLGLARATEETTAEWNRPDGRIYCALQRARAYVMLNRAADAEVQISSAAALIDQQTEVTIRVAWQTELDVTRGFALVSRRPGRAAGSFDEAVRSLTSQNRPFRVAELLLFKGRALAKMGQTANARLAWEHGLAILEDQRAEIRDEQLKVLRTAGLWELFGELIDATLQDATESLGYAERSRGRQLLDRMTAGQTPRSFPVTTLQSSLRPNEVALIYTVEPKRLIVWTATTAGVTVTTRAVGAAELEGLVARARAALMLGTSSPALRELADAVLPLPLDLAGRERLIVVPDGVLQSAPFAALALADGRHLIEHLPVLMSPSLTSFAVASGLARGAGVESAALVGFAGPVAAAGLAALPGVAEETLRIARLYPSRHVLIGRDATMAALLKVAPLVDVIHLAGHAQADRLSPARSTLWMAPSEGDTGAVTAAQFAGLRLRTGATVVLGACDTAIGPDIKGEGAASLVPPFLAAGASLVVGTLWPINDREAIAAFEMLHKELRRGGAIADAVANVQRRLLARRTPSSVWASLVAYGGRS